MPCTGRVVVVDAHCNFNGGVDMIMFNFLSLISGFCEIGIVVWGMKLFGITGALLGGLFYQIGNMAPNPITLSQRMCWILLSSSLAFGLAGFFQPVFLYPALTLFTMALQNERSVLKNKTNNTGSKVLKRAFRIIGFALGFLFRIESFFICLIAIVVICIICKEDDNKKTGITIPHFNKLDVILILHEIHYFVYCYCALLIVYRLTVSGVYAALAFALTWLPYASGSNIYEKTGILGKLGYKKTFLLGHSILAVIFVLMFMFYRIQTSSGTVPLISFVIWFFTGILGTTEFCVEKVDKLNKTYVKTNHDSAENIGHILGVVLSIVLYLITKDLSISVLVAGAFALAALLLMAIFVKEETK